MIYLGTDVPTKFHQIHAAAGRDATFFLYVVREIKVSQWKRKAEASKHSWCFMQIFRLLKSYSSCLLPWGRRRESYQNQGAIV